MEEKRSTNKLLDSLQERAKELDCLYRIDGILSHFNQPLDQVCIKTIEAIPPGWQYPDICKVRITLENVTYTSPGFQETPWFQSVSIRVHDDVIGTICVYYTEDMPTADSGCFLEEETRLLMTIADRLGDFIMHQKAKGIVQELDRLRLSLPDKRRAEWAAILDTLKNADKNLYFDISRRMFTHLCQKGITEAQRLYSSFVPDHATVAERKRSLDLRVLQERWPMDPLENFSSSVFGIARDHLSNQETLELIQGWVIEEKLVTLAQVLNRNLSLADVADAIRRYQSTTNTVPQFSSPSQRAIQVSLTRRILSDDLIYIDIAKDYVGIPDFHDLLQSVIYSSDSHGKVGGKSAGLFLAAQILKAESNKSALLNCIKTPKSWYVTSDVLLSFTYQPDLNHVMVQKYKDLDQIRLEYPLILKAFRSAPFSANLSNALGMALDDFGDRPLVVRSSSFLEDHEGADFAGKYMTIFLPNLGSKQERLSALKDAVVEVYASTFGPKPIEFRASNGLLDFDEEMGILIQEVVGTKVGRYFLPTFSGVAQSKIDVSQYPDRKPEDGLLQLVRGLGGRAGQPHDDNQSVLVIPGFAGTQVSISDDELTRFSPKTIDVIDLQTGSLETLDSAKFVEQFGTDYVDTRGTVSRDKSRQPKEPVDTGIFHKSHGMSVSLAGSSLQAPFSVLMSTILRTLEKALRAPVQIEFASDGQYLYLLQCRRYGKL
jgi:pyruvate,water dikinase